MAAPVYLFTGPEFGERNDQVALVKENLKKKFGESDDYLLYASDTKIEDIIVKLRTESLFSPATCIVLREAEAIKNKDEIEMISSWIDSVTPSSRNRSPSESSVLIFVSDEISVDAKLEKLIPKENKKIFWEMFENRKESWVQNFFYKNGFSVEVDAIELILEMVENNTEALRSECSRFFYCFPKNHVISVHDVEQILAHNREETAFTLFESMTDYRVSVTKRLENAAAILQKILLTKGSNAVMLISGLVSCFRKLQIWHSIASNGEPSETILKSNGFISKKMRTQYANASKVWTAGQCVAIIALLSATDMEMRSLGTGLHSVQLFLLLYGIIVKKGASCSVYE